MPLNFKKIRKVAKGRLQYGWDVTLRKDSISEWQSNNYPPFPAFTQSKAVEMTHQIHLNLINSPSEIDIYHEFCHVKMNESGFLDAEKSARNRIETCTTQTPYVREKMASLVWIAENLCRLYSVQYFF